MIPTFPEFKKIAVEDQKDIKRITNQFDPYSDFNFTSIYSYNTLELAEISQKGNTLVMKFTDYDTNAPFYTFIGNDEVTDSIEKVLELSVKNGFGDKLKLIPEVNIKENANVLSEKFIISEDRDNFDYVYSIEKLATLAGRHYDGHRNIVKRFHEKYHEVVIKEVDLGTTKIQEQIAELVQRWGKNKNKTQEEIETEFTAIERLLKIQENLQLTAIATYDKDLIIGFSIEEILNPTWAIAHFGKADTTYPGIFQIMEHAHAKLLHSKNVEKLNYEQDLGIEGLRRSKLNWGPIDYLKKYTICPKA